MSAYLVYGPWGNVARRKELDAAVAHADRLARALPGHSYFVVKVSEGREIVYRTTKQEVDQ